MMGGGANIRGEHDKKNQTRIQSHALMDSMHVARISLFNVIILAQ